MRKNFLLLLWLTMLPLAMMAQSATWKSGSAPDLTYGANTSDFGNLVTVTSSYGSATCTNYGEGTATPTGNNNRYRWQIYDSSSNPVSASSTLNAGDYTLRLYIRHRSGLFAYNNATRDLTFSIKKADNSITGLALASWLEGEAANTPTYTSVTFGTPSWEYSIDGGSTWSATVPTLGGNWLVRASIAESTNYKEFKSEGVAFKIQKVATLSGLSLQGGLIYNDQDRLLISGTPSFPVDYDTTNGGVKYQVTTNPTKPTTDASEEPQRKDAGTYYVWYKALADGDIYVDGDWTQVGSTAVKISPRDITAADFTVTGATLIFKDDFQALINNFAWDNDIPRGTVEFGESASGPWYAIDALKEKDANPDPGYPVFVKITGNANHNDYTSAAAEISVPIALAAPVVAATEADKIVTGLEYISADKTLLSAPLEATFEGAAVAGTFTYYINDGAGTTALPVGDNAGEYTISYSFAPATSDFSPIDKTELGKTTIATSFVQRTGAPALASSPQPYSGNPITLVTDNFTTIDGGTVKYYVQGALEADATEFDFGADEGKKTNADTYTLSYKFFADATGNYKDDENVTEIGPVVIGKKGLHIGAQSLNVDYGTTVEAAQLIKADEDEFVNADKSKMAEIVATLVELKSIEGATAPALPTDAGNYNFTLQETGADGNYEIIDFIPDGVLSINKIAPTPAAVTAADLTYTGDPLALLVVDPAALDGGDMLYYLGETAPSVGSEKWETAVPEETDAKNAYKVWYMTKGDKNHNDIAAASYDVVIKQKDIATAKFNINPAESVFTGENQNGTTITINPIENEKLNPDKDIKLITLPAEMTAQGDYDITIEAQGNYTGTTTKTFTIKEATNEWTAEAAAAEGLVYTGKELTLVGDEAKAKFGEVLYSLDETTWGAASTIKAVDADKYTVYYQVEATPDFTGLTGSFEAEITQAPNEVTVELAGWTYGGTAKEPVVTAKFAATGEPVISYSADGETWGTYEDIVADQAGDYTIKATVEETTNWAAAEATAPFTIDPKAVTPTLPKALALTYNGLDQALIEAGEAEGTDIAYAIVAIDGTPVDGDAPVADIPQAKNAGTYTVKYVFAENPNYAYSTYEGTVDVKINKAHVSYRMGNQTETYKGDTYAPVEGKAYQLVDGDLMVGDEDAFTFAFTEDVDAVNANNGVGFTELAVTFKDDVENYTIQFVNNGVLYINKAELIENTDYTAPKAIEGLIYDGSTMKLVDGASVKVDETPLGTGEAMGTIMYADSKTSETWTTEIPEEQNAGEYEVWFKIVGDKNHEDTDPVQIENVAIGAAKLLAEWLPEKYQEPVVEDYKAEKFEFNDIELEGLEVNTDYEVIAPEIFNASEYEIEVKGLNNFAGSSLYIPVTINKLELIATAPNAEKTYDGTTTVEPEEFGEFMFNGLLKGDHIDLGELTVADVISVPADAINVGTYTLEVNLTEFPEQKNYVINAADILPGTLTINPAAAVKIGFKEGVTYSKSYATEDNLAVIADDLTATEGDLFVEPAEFAQLLTISREEGEVYKKDGYTVSLDFSTKESLLEAIAKFKKNYESVSFGTTKFFITPFAGNIKVSIASASSVYDGNVPTYAWAEDLSNMVVTGIDADKKAEIFSKLPTVTISGITADAGDYNIELAKDFESVNFDPEKITLVLGSYYTIEQFDLANAEVTIPKQQAKVGDEAEKVIDATAFTIKGLPVEADAAGFAVAAADDFVQETDNVLYIVEGEDYTKGLVLVSANDDITKNYTGWENGEITGNLIVEGGEELVLDDSGAITTTSTGNKTVKVTFTSRTINPGTWNVLVLPFKVTPAQVSAAFGYAVVDILNKEKNQKGDIHFMINTTEEIPAGKPFIVKPGKDLAENEKENFTEITFTGVKIEAFSDNTEDADDNGNKFIGTFKDTQIGGQQYRYMSKGMWYDARNFESKPLTIKPLRAFIEMAPENVNARIFIEEADGTVTAIDGVTFNNELNEGMYNLNGMKVNNARKGVFIQNGKKVIK